MQDKRAEINLTKLEIEEGAWEDTAQHIQSRTKQIQLIQGMLHRDSLILDAGCGPGNYGMLLAQENDVIGLDISVMALKTATERARAADDRFSPLAGDLEMLPFKDNTFDLCFCAFTLHHFPSIDNAVAELVRVTRSEGKIVLLDLNGSNPGVRLSIFLEKIIERWLVKKGLDTPNETHHTPKYLCATLEELGVRDIYVHSHFFGGMPPMRPNPGFLLSLLYLVVRLRWVMYHILAKLLPKPIGGAEVLIAGTKMMRH